MGIEYSAKIMVGLKCKDMEDVDEDLLDELDSIAPYYDGGYDAILGYVIEDSGDYSSSTLYIPGLIEEADAAFEKFKQLTGKEPKLWLTTCGW